MSARRRAPSHPTVGGEQSRDELSTGGNTRALASGLHKRRAHIQQRDAVALCTCAGRHRTRQAPLEAPQNSSKYTPCTSKAVLYIRRPEGKTLQRVMPSLKKKKGNENQKGFTRIK